MENRGSVILADASEEYRAVLSRAIEGTGEFQVVGSTGSGVEALRLVQQKHPQLLLLDLVLPALDGFGQLRELLDMGVDVVGRKNHHRLHARRASRQHEEQQCAK